MEMEFFVEPSTAPEWYRYWIDTRLQWYIDLGINRGQPAPLRASPRSCRTTRRHHRHRVQVRFRRQPVGELEGIVNRPTSTCPPTQTAFRRRPDVLRPGHRHPLHAVRHRTGARSDAVPRHSWWTPTTRTRRPMPGAGWTSAPCRDGPETGAGQAAVLPLSRHADLSPAARSGRRVAPVLEHRIRRRGRSARRYRRQDEIGTCSASRCPLNPLEDQAGDDP